MTGMYWGEFQELLERNKREWTAFRYYRSKSGFKDSISICDFTLPRRSDHTHTGHAADDWYRDSFVCNVAYLEGWIPYRDNSPVYNDAEHKWDVHPQRGMTSALKMLVDQKCLKRTEEVQRLLKEIV